MKVKRLEKTACKQQAKDRWSFYIISYEIDLGTKTVNIDKEQHFIIFIIYLEFMTIIKIYAPKNRAPKYTKKITDRIEERKRQFKRLKGHVNKIQSNTCTSFES